MERTRRHLAAAPRAVLAALAFASSAVMAPGGVVHAAETPEIMMAMCKARAHDELKVRGPDIDTKYEGQRVDGTHAVNGTAAPEGGKQQTFQCSFNADGSKIIRFVVND